MARPDRPVFNTLAKSRNHQQGQLSSQTLTILALLLFPPTLVLFTIVPSSLRLLTLTYAFAINTATYIVYRHDKQIALAAAAGSPGGWRVREVSLHLWALSGGWPAAFVAQRVLRHKTRKWEFLVVFWAIVVGEELMLLCLMIWLFVG